MSIEAINEQLLRAIGVGVALLDRPSFSFHFRNDTFEEWFEDRLEGGKLKDVFEDLDFDALEAALKDAGRFTAEIKHKKKG